MMNAAPTRRGDERFLGNQPSGVANPADADSPRAGRRKREAERWLRRRLLERQLHDGASLRLSALSLRLGLLDPAIAGDDREWQARIGELQHQLHLVLDELREVASQIYPPLLDQAGLGSALGELAEGAEGALEVEVNGDAGRRFGAVAEGAAYFVVAECLASRTPGRSGVLRVTLDTAGDAVVMTARGIDEDCLDRVLDHVQPLGGSAQLQQSDDEAITITVRIPCD